MADDDAGTAADGPGTDAAPQAQDAGGNGTPEGSQGGTGAPAATAGGDDRGAENLLADAVAAGDSDTEAATGKDELAAAKAELARWKKQARENEARAKANAAKAKDYDAYTESQMTEQQKLAARAEAAEQAAAEAQGKYHRTLAAATYDLPPSMIDQLGNGTEDEINARAETFAAAINERAAVLAAAQARRRRTASRGSGPAATGTATGRLSPSAPVACPPATATRRRTPTVGSATSSPTASASSTIPGRARNGPGQAPERGARHHPRNRRPAAAQLAASRQETQPWPRTTPSFPAPSGARTPSSPSRCPLRSFRSCPSSPPRSRSCARRSSARRRCACRCSTSSRPPTGWVATPA